MILITAIAILSGIVQITGYALYSKHVFWGTTRPNTASWSVWAFGAVLESVSYVFLADDMYKSILPIACAACAVLFFLVCLVRGHFEKVTRFEMGIIIADVVITIIWYMTNSPFLANVLLIVTAVISFIPIVLNVYKNPTYENAFPWFVWSAAYGLQTLTVIGRYEKFEDLFYPVIFLVLHVVVALLALDYRKKRSINSMKNLSRMDHPEHL